MTYNVFGGTLNPTLLYSMLSLLSLIYLTLLYPTDPNYFFIFIIK